MSATPKIIFFSTSSSIADSGLPGQGKKDENQGPSQLRTGKKSSGTYNIFELHNRILQIFDKEYQELGDMKIRKEKLEQILIKTQDEIEKQKALEECSKLKNKIYLIDSGIREAQYLYKTDQIIKEYEILLNKPIKIDFMGRGACAIGNGQKKQNLITSFINIAKNYIDIIPSSNNTRLLICEDCNVEMYKMDDLLFICPECCSVTQQLASLASYQDNNRINSAQRYVYDKRAHFGDSIKKFQGKQNTTIPRCVYDDIWEKIASHDLKVEQITKDHIYDFLKITKHTEYYEDIILIYAEITGNNAPDISHLEEHLFELFDEIDPVYERIKPKDRVNFLNGQFVLFKLLQKLKFPCKEEDFYILKTRDKMLEHDKIWKGICQELKWTYIATV